VSHIIGVYVTNTYVKKVRLHSPIENIVNRRLIIDSICAKVTLLTIGTFPCILFIIVNWYR